MMLLGIKSLSEMTTHDVEGSHPGYAMTVIDATDREHLLHIPDSLFDQLGAIIGAAAETVVAQEAQPVPEEAPARGNPATEAEIAAVQAQLRQAELEAVQEQPAAEVPDNVVELRPEEEDLFRKVGMLESQEEEGSVDLMDLATYEGEEDEDYEEEYEDEGEDFGEDDGVGQA